MTNQPTYSLYSKSTRDNGWCFIKSSPFRAPLVDTIEQLVTELYPQSMRGVARDNYRIIEQ